METTNSDLSSFGSFEPLIVTLLSIGLLLVKFCQFVQSIIFLLLFMPSILCLLSGAGSFLGSVVSVVS